MDFPNDWNLNWCVVGTSDWTWADQDESPSFIRTGWRHSCKHAALCRQSWIPMYCGSEQGTRIQKGTLWKSDSEQTMSTDWKVACCGFIGEAVGITSWAGTNWDPFSQGNALAAVSEEVLPLVKEDSGNGKELQESSGMWIHEQTIWWQKRSRWWVLRSRQTKWVGIRR
jgi:hypothetical protein